MNARSPFIALLALLLLLAPTSRAATDEEVDNLLSWAEIKFSTLFVPKGVASQVADGYRYRYYPSSRTAAGYRADNQQLYFLGTDGVIKPLGDIAPYLDQARIPPASAAEMKAYLDARAYSAWPVEAGIRASSVHFGNVRIWTNPTLKASLAAGNAEHPSGSAAIKELYGSGSQLRGWAAMVRTRSGGGADGWYWYEFFDGSLVGEGQGATRSSGACSSCHSAGRDFSCQPPGNCNPPTSVGGW
jgi:hypothetical protein